MENNNEIKLAVEKLTEAIKTDMELRISYQANIAMAFKDAYKQYFSLLTEDTGEVHESIHVHNIANNAANNFLKIWCNADFDRID